MLKVYSTSSSFLSHVNQLLSNSACVFSSLSRFSTTDKYVHLIHASSYSSQELSALFSQNQKLKNNIALADDAPSVSQLLLYTELGVRAYCNSYMAIPHFKQLLFFVEQGQSWFPPMLLSEALALARNSTKQLENDERFFALTPREKQIAYGVANGNSNKLIAKEYGISERTVKAHLTHIFEKTQVKDRLGLAIYVNQASNSIRYI